MKQHKVVIESRHIQDNHFTFHWKVINEKGETKTQSFTTFPTKEQAVEHFNEQKKVLGALSEINWDEEAPPREATRSPITDVNLEIRMLQNKDAEIINRLLEAEREIIKLHKEREAHAQMIKNRYNENQDLKSRLAKLERSVFPEKK